MVGKESQIDLEFQQLSALAQVNGPRSVRDLAVAECEQARASDRPENCTVWPITRACQGPEYPAPCTTTWDLSGGTQLVYPCCCRETMSCR